MIADGRSTPRVRQFHSNDPEKFRNQVALSLGRHRIDILRRSERAAMLRQFDIGNSQIVDISYGTDVRIEADQPRDHYLVHASLSGVSGYVNDGARDQIDAQTIHVTCPGVPARFEMSPDCRHLTLRLPESIFAERLAAMQIPSSKPVMFQRRQPSGAGFAELWRRTLEQIASHIDNMPLAMSADLVQRQYVTLLADLVLTNCRNSYTPQIELYGSTACPWHVKRARDIIHANTDELLSIPALAAQVGVSARSLQNGFRQFLGMTPVEYVRFHRLERLHSALRTAGPGASVTELMLDCGIANFGRYARYYQQLYGRRPSETLKTPRL